MLTLVIAPILLINGLSMPMQARVQRDLRFGTLAMIDVVSMLGGVGLGIVAAVLGWGVWSLVVMSGDGQLYRLIALWVASRPRFGRPHISREVLPLVTTGGSIFGVQLLNYAAKNLDNVIIGQQLGPAVLGQYSRAYALYLLPLQQLNGTLGRVALPVLSKLQDDGERYRRYIRGALMIIGYLTIPVYAVAAAVSSPLIAVLLGPGWEEAATLFSLLAIAGIAQSIGSVLGWLYITLGRAHRQFVYDLVTRPMVIAGYFLGIWWAGVEGLALVYGLLTMALLVPGFYFATVGHLRARRRHPPPDHAARDPRAALLRRRVRRGARDRRAAGDRAAHPGCRRRRRAAPRLPRDPRVPTRPRADRRIRQAGAQARPRRGRTADGGTDRRRRGRCRTTRSSCANGRGSPDADTDHDADRVHSARGARRRRARGVRVGRRPPRPTSSELEPPAAAPERGHPRHPRRLRVPRRERLRRTGAVRRRSRGRAAPTPAVGSVADAPRRGIRSRAEVVNAAKDGGDVDDALGLVDEVSRRSPQLVTVLLGGNDACAPTLDEMTPAADYEAAPHRSCSRA